MFLGLCHSRLTDFQEASLYDNSYFLVANTPPPSKLGLLAWLRVWRTGDVRKKKNNEKEDHFEQFMIQNYTEK